MHEKAEQTPYDMTSTSGGGLHGVYANSHWSRTIFKNKIKGTCTELQMPAMLNTLQNDDGRSKVQ